MKVKGLLLRVGVSVAALALVFYMVPLADIRADIANCDGYWLVVGVALQLLVRVITAVRMTILAAFQKLELGFLSMLRIVFVSAFYGLFLPGALVGGAVTFVKYLQYGGSAAASLTNVLANKGYEILSAGLLVLLAWLALNGVEPRWFPLVTILLTVLFLLFVKALFSGLIAFGRLQRWLQTKPGKLAGHTVKILHQLEALGRFSWTQTIILVVASFIVHALSATSMFCFAVSLDIPVPFAALILVYALVYLLALLPVSFSNIGVREAGMIFLFQPFGVSAAEAAAWSVIMYSGLLVSAAFGGVMEMCGPSPLPCKGDRGDKVDREDKGGEAQ